RYGSTALPNGCHLPILTRVLRPNRSYCALSIQSEQSPQSMNFLPWRQHAILAHFNENLTNWDVKLLPFWGQMGTNRSAAACCHSDRSEESRPCAGNRDPSLRSGCQILGASQKIRSRT